MKRIGYLVNSLKNVGPVIVLLDIVKNLDRTKFSPYILVLKKENVKDSKLNDFLELNCIVKEFNFSFMQMELETKGCSIVVESYLEKENISCVHLHGYHPVLIARYIDLKIKKIVTLHNICGEDFRRQKGILFGTYMTRRYISNLRYCDVLVGITNTTANYYRDKLKKKQIITIYNGVDVEKYKLVTPVEKMSLKKQINIREDVSVYVIIGVLRSLKNCIYILKMIKKLEKTENKLFIFVGDGPLMKKCLKMSTSMDNILFVGKKTDVTPYYKIADFSISASKSEGFGLVPLESILSGVTLLYSDIPTYLELFYSNDMLKQYMFKLKEKDSLCKLLKTCTVISDKECLREYYKVEFSNYKMSVEYQKLY